MGLLLRFLTFGTNHLGRLNLLVRIWIKQDGFERVEMLDWSARSPAAYAIFRVHRSTSVQIKTLAGRQAASKLTVTLGDR